MTGERADGTESEVEQTGSDGPAPASLTDQARDDARRAARAVRLARRTRQGTAAATAGATPAAEPVATPVSVTEPEPVPTPVSVTKAAPGATSTPTTKAERATRPAPTTAQAVDEAATTDATDTTADTDTTDDETDTGTDAPATARRRPRRVTVVAAVAAVLALAFAIVAFVVHVQAGDRATTSPAAARDAALLAARQDIVVLNTLDYTDVEGGLQRWLGATTGTLRDQLSQVSDTDKQAIAVSKSRTTASVLAAAVTQVDAAKGEATVMASVQIDVTPDGGQATQKRTRFSLTMQRVGDVWKIGAVTQVGVTLT